jgi:hypothetical protein
MYVSFHALLMKSLQLTKMLISVTADREFLGRRYENRYKACWMAVIFEKNFFHKNDKLKQKRVAA